MMSQPIKIVYACNDKYFDGLYLSILSILRRTKSVLSFYVLTANYTKYSKSFLPVSANHKKILKNLVTFYNNKNSIKFIDCKKTYERLLGNSPNNECRCSIYTNFRILIDQFDFFTGKIIYLDTDTMALGDIKILFDVDIGDNEFAAAHNSITIRWYQKKDYFNAGVMLLNANKIRKTKFFKKARHILNTENIQYDADQAAMYKSKTKFMFFPDEYRFNRQHTPIRKNDVIKHFSSCAFHNIKQWEIKKVHRWLHIHHFDEDYKIYLAEKKNAGKKW